MFELSITSSKVIWLLAAIFLIYTIFWFYRTLNDDFYPSRIKKILFILRCFAILIFLVLLLDLSIEHQRFHKSLPQVAFLWDMSQSMSVNESYDPSTVFRTPFYKKLSKVAELTHFSNMALPEIYSEAQLKALSCSEKLSDNSALIRAAENMATYDELFLLQRQSTNRPGP